jgi:hypothetical protein
MEFKRWQIITALVAVGSMLLGSFAVMLNQQLYTGEIVGALLWMFIGVMSLALFISWVIFPWFIWQIMRDVGAMREQQRQALAELRQSEAVATHCELMRQQIAELQSINAKLLGAEIAREQA